MIIGESSVVNLRMEEHQGGIRDGAPAVVGGTNAQSIATESDQSPHETNPQTPSLASKAQSPGSARKVANDFESSTGSGSPGDGSTDTSDESAAGNSRITQPGTSTTTTTTKPEPDETRRLPASMDAGRASIATAIAPSTASSFALQQQPALAPIVAADKGQSSTIGMAVAPLAVLSTATAEKSLLTLAPPPSEMTNVKQATVQLPIPSVTTAGQPKGKPSANLRRGKWTMEEEAYVARVIQDFNSGFLNAPAGTTLRSYLSEKLQCDPMRITKKFTGDSCIGKRVFHPAVRSPSNAAAIDKAQAELDSLERRWRRRLEMQQRECAKKAAASAAAAAAASGRTHGFVTQGSMGVGLNGSAAGLNGQTPRPNVVTQTASWLDRASNILKETGSQTGFSLPCTNQKFSLTQEQAQALQSLPKNEIEKQMKEVERLIHEGPIIQQTSAGLPLVLHQSASNGSPQAAAVPSTILASTTGAISTSRDGQQSPPEPADKRMRTGAEDAEALVGFLTAVRASAAAGTDTFSG